MTAKPIPEGYHSITSYLIVDGAAKAIEFYKQAFGAEEIMRFPGADGRVDHAEIRIGDSVMMIADEHPQMNARGPKGIGGTPVSFLLYVRDCDATVKIATDAGAKLIRPIANQFYGDRSGTVEDPFGHVWTIATHVEDVSPDEMGRRAAKHSC